MAAVSTRDRTNQEVLADLEETLSWDGRIDSTGIEPEISNGVVTLKGSVPNYTSRAAAVEQARLTPGVSQVEDRLRVEIQGSGPGMDDDVLTARANDSLQWASALEGSDIRALVREGTVELEGSVDAHWKIQRAFNLVMGIRGVTDVKNNLAVVPTDDVADEALAEQILQALRRNVLVDESRIEVEVNAGVVTLKGSVPSWMEANTVREVVSNTPGTLDIKDLLETDREPAPA